MTSTSMRVAGVSYADKAIARAAQAAVDATITSPSPTRAVAATTPLVTSRIRVYHQHHVHQEVDQEKQEDTTAAHAPAPTRMLNPMASAFVPNTPPLSPAAPPEPEPERLQIIDEGEEEEEEEEWAEDDEEEDDDYEDDYEEDAEAEEEPDAYADLARLELLERPSRNMLFNVKCRYFNDGKEGCTKPHCRFLHDEEPFVHDMLSIETSTTSTVSSYCGLCDSPVNGTFYYMSFSTPEETPVVHAPPPDITRIYVGNMPNGCNKTYLKTLLATVDISVVNIGVNRSKLSCKHRSAFVQVNAGDAERAIKTLHEHQFDGVSLYAHLKEWDDASPNDIMHAGW